jgi:hypothetical protein
MNKLTEIINETNATTKKTNMFIKTIDSDKGIYEWLKIGMDLYLKNQKTEHKNPAYFFEDLDDAVGYLKKDYRCK